MGFHACKSSDHSLTQSLPISVYLSGQNESPVSQSLAIVEKLLGQKESNSLELVDKASKAIAKAPTLEQVCLPTIPNQINKKPVLNCPKKQLIRTDQERHEAVNQALLDISTGSFPRKIESHEREASVFSAASKYAGLCGTALCFVMNPRSGNMIQVRALLDSGANLTMINRSIAQSIGLTGEKIQVSIGVAGGGTLSRKEMEVVFQLVKKDKQGVTMPLVGITTESVGNPFRPVDFNPKKHEHLKDLDLADKFPAQKERPFQLLISEPYFSQLEKDEKRMSPTPSVPSACLTQLGWVLRGATGVLCQVAMASAFGAIAEEHETFDLDTMYKSIGFDFGKFWSGENVGISPGESMTSDLTALEIQAEEFQSQPPTMMLTISSGVSNCHGLMMILKHIESLTI